MRGKLKRGKTLVGAFTRARDGAVLVVVAFLLFVLAGAAALSVDLGRAWNLDTQLQDAADACALAAASQLDNTAGSRARAIDACTVAVDKLVENRQSFATDLGGPLVEFAPTDFIFYSDLGDPAVPRDAVQATGDTDADFVRVHAQSREVGFYFAAAVGAVSSASPDAFAVAGLTVAQCQSQPIMFCNPYDDETNPPFDISDPNLNPPPEFQGISIVLDQGGPNSKWEPGNFGLLSVSQPGANALRDAMGRVNPINECFGNFVETKTGQITSIRQGLNVRFDMYDASFSGGQTDPQYIPARNTVKGLMKTPDMTDCTYHNDQSGGWYKGANPYDGTWDGVSAAGRPDVMGFPRDACLYTGACSLPVGPLGPPAYMPNPQSRFGDGSWAMNAYMEVNHSGVAYTGACAACATGGMPTRHEVYEWEKDLGNEPWNDGPESGSEGGNMCNTVTPIPDPPDPDRRIIRVAVINCVSPVHNCDTAAGESPELLNCETVSGKTKNVLLVEPDGWLHMFLLEPMGVYNTNNHVVAEVVDPGANSPLVDTTNKYIVQLYPLPYVSGP